MNDFYDVIVFSAHPDDAEFVMCGTMVKLVRSGFRLLHVSLTKAQMSTNGDVETRMAQFAKASAIIGCAHIALDLLDTDVQNTRENRLLAARLIRQHKPQVVFAPYHTNPAGELGGIANVDHYTTGALVRDAVKMARLQKTDPALPPHQIRKLYFYMLPANVRPNLVVDVSNEMEQVIETIMTYENQVLHTHFNLSVKDRILARHAAMGLEIGVRYAEGFVTDMALSLEPRHFFEL
ncbi:MAG TPA: PIG-L family deacetylase [Oligoflexia bacterium]|nr:PIG-L family deacetylase [Oligoflexia bacterium]